MNDLGYLYVLANSAMPGLLKVGKTTRTPSERAGELSGVTGIPTPFIVVYEQLFQDCAAAESFVHTYLAQKGYRTSDTREFFSAPTNIVIRAMGLVPGAIDNDTLQLNLDPLDELFEPGAPDELDSPFLSQSEPIRPWLSIFEEAEMHYFGQGDCLQDYAEAMRLFRQAAKLGSVAAYRYIGEMYENGEGVIADTAKALDFYKRGARGESIYCYWRMGRLFSKQDNDENADKCFALFLKNMPDIYPHHQLILQDIPDIHPNGVFLKKVELFLVLDECVSIIFSRRLRMQLDRHLILNDFVERWSEAISECAGERLIGCEPNMVQLYKDTIKDINARATLDRCVG